MKGATKALLSVASLTARREWTRGVRTWLHEDVWPMLLYLGAFAVVMLVGLWQSYRPPLPYAPDLAAALVTATLLAALLARRPAFGLEHHESTLIAAPGAPWAALAGGVWRRAAPLAGVGSVLAVGLLAWWPNWWPLALSLPGLLTAVPFLASAAHDARVGGHPGRQGALFVAAGLPLLGMLHPALLPVGAWSAALLAVRFWAQSWQTDVNPRLVARMELEGLRQGARRLGLPFPAVDADGKPRPRLWTPAWTPRSQRSAALWRSLAHLGRAPWVALAALPLGAAMLGVLGTPTMPVLLAWTLMPLITLLPPALPDCTPVPETLSRLGQVLPVAVLLGGLALPGAVALAVLGSLPTALAAATVLTPWAALSAYAALDRLGGQNQRSAGQARFGAALAPALAVQVCLMLGVVWLSPALLLVLGGAALKIG